MDSALHILLVKILEVYLQLPANEVSCRRQLTATFFKLIYEQYQSLEFPGIELKPAQMILEYLERHYYKQDLSIAQLAEDLGYSQQYLNRQLRLHQGCSIRQQLIKIRLRHALELLRSERFLITDAARLTGWQSSFYFSNVFKQYYGVRPCNWKKIAD